MQPPGPPPPSPKHVATPILALIVVMAVVVAAVVGLVFLRPASEIPASVAFRETGLPKGRGWSVTLGNDTQTSSSDTIVVRVIPGTYTFGVSLTNGTDYVPYPASGHLSVNTTGATIPIAFVRSKANVTVQETGLPDETWWALGEGTTHYSTNATSMNITEPDGNHSLRVLAAVNTQVYDARPPRITQGIYVPNVSSLSVTLNGSDVVLPVHFALAVNLNWSRFAISVFPYNGTIPSPAYAYMAFTFYRYTTANVSFYGTMFGGVPQGLTEYLMTPPEFDAFTATGNTSRYVETSGNVSQGNLSMNFVSGTWYFVLTGWSLDEWRAYTLAWLITFPGIVVYFS
jgi:hypothetical protein